ncbi:MAG: hypothetical protein KI791_05810 [Cyclobacteriaceae bacterium]|nr:hypothetical protein [Cyclobacteriaceae bacterium SS2]
MKLNITIAVLICFVFASCNKQQPKDTPINISGVYPHLAYYNNEGECGTGAVVPWADRLWVVTYGPHFPKGSSDKLYEITPDLQQIVREESLGGTPANRMIHRESNQLFIGPHAIDAQGGVRTIPYAIMPGRHTGNARHLFNPAEKIYYGTMEEGFYEVDVRTLAVDTLYLDANMKRKHGDMAQSGDLLLGAHGKGLYSGQGVMVYSNNGEANQRALKEFDIESGALYEWDGKEWKLVRRNQFVEVTGPGGIYGNDNAETDPIWTTGWDHKSVLLGVRSADKGWSFYRLPKASHSYDGAHGWNTEWPRIRDIGTADSPDYLMTMHGMFWKFPGTFSSANTAGIRPRSAYLKVIGDFTRWNDQLVFGCDDSAQREFLNKRKVKGNIEGPGQSNSNLWFTSIDMPDKLGPNTAEGAVWLSEEVKANEISEPFLFSGWPYRTVWVKNEGGVATTFTFEVDDDGSGNYEAVHSTTIPAGVSKRIIFSDTQSGEWVRMKSDKETKATVHFYYSDKEERSSAKDSMFDGIATVNDSESIGGLLYGLGDNRRALGVAATQFSGVEAGAASYYELDEKLNLVPKKDEETLKFIKEKFAIPQQVVTIDKSSVLVVDDLGRRWRLPLSSEVNFTSLTNASALRIDREVATERDLMNCHGTFYELPAENADGFAKIRPVSSHGYRIHDYASYRGLLVMTGISPSANTENEHIIVSEDGKAAVWAGVIDDLWKLGKPTGQGGPWYETEVSSGVPSDPYLIGFYDDRSLSITHDGTKPVNFSIEVEPVGHGPWMVYDQVSVAPGETFTHQFPADFQARWIRFTTDSNVKATTKLVYK